MKILVLAMPRTGSKFVCTNLSKYLGHCLVFDIKEFYPNDEIYIEADKIKVIPNQLSDINKFYDNRLAFIKEWNTNIVVKCHYEKLLSHPEILENLLTCFNQVIVVYRKNEFEQLLSHILSEYLDCWIKSEKQNHIKSQVGNAPIEIDLDRWRHKILVYNKSRSMNFSNFTEIYCEDMFNMSCDEFSASLDLPEKEFGIIRDMEEYGADKFKMISNIEQLRQIYNELRFKK